MSYTLVIGDRSYSSWSLRGWLMFARFGLPVTVQTARLYSPEITEVLGRLRDRSHRAGSPGRGGRRGLRPLGHLRYRRDACRAPSGSRPLACRPGCARDGPDGSGGDACELPAAARGLPDEPAARLPRFRAASGRARLPVADRGAVERGARGRWRRRSLAFRRLLAGGRLLRPVAARIATYGLPTGAEGAAYVAAHLADAAFLDWRAEGLADPFVQPDYDLDLPERPWPGPTR